MLSSVIKLLYHVCDKIDDKNLKIKLLIAIDEIEEVEEEMQMTGKRYTSVIAMVKDICGRKFAKEVEKHLQESSVFVYRKGETFLVFSSFKKAKKFVKSISEEKGKLQWQKQDKERGYWLHSCGASISRMSLFN